MEGDFWLHVWVGAATGVVRELRGCAEMRPLKLANPYAQAGRLEGGYYGNAAGEYDRQVTVYDAQHHGYYTPEDVLGRIMAESREVWRR